MTGSASCSSACPTQDSLVVSQASASLSGSPCWRLHSVKTCIVHGLGDQAIASPRHRMRHISVVFFNYSSPWMRTSSSSVSAARLLHTPVSAHVQIPLLCSRNAPRSRCTTDAFVKGDLVALGSWFLSPGDDSSLGQTVQAGAWRLSAVAPSCPARANAAAHFFGSACPTRSVRSPMPGVRAQAQ